jgi:hypothetical protein
MKIFYCSAWWVFWSHWLIGSNFEEIPQSKGALLNLMKRMLQGAWELMRWRAKRIVGISLREPKLISRQWRLQSQRWDACSFYNHFGTEISHCFLNVLVRNWHLHLIVLQFNRKPTKGIEYLLSNKLIENKASSVAQFLKSNPSLDKVISRFHWASCCNNITIIYVICQKGVHTSKFC